MLIAQYGNLDIKYTFSHIRKLDKAVNGHALSGMTICFIEIWEPSGPRTYVSGTALCSASDNFDKEKGRKIALTRALERSGVSREMRKAVWKSYFLRHIPKEKLPELPLFMISDPGQLTLVEGIV